MMYVMVSHRTKCPNNFVMYTEQIIAINALSICHISYKGVRSCPTKTCYTLTNGKINSNQFLCSINILCQLCHTVMCVVWVVVVIVKLNTGTITLLRVTTCVIYYNVESL